MKIILLGAKSLIVDSGVIAQLYCSIDGEKTNFYNLETFGSSPHFFRSDEDILEELKTYTIFEPFKEKPYYVDNIFGLDVTSYKGIKDSLQKGVSAEVDQFIFLLLALTRCSDDSLEDIVLHSEGKDIMELKIPAFTIRL